MNEKHNIKGFRESKQDYKALYKNGQTTIININNLTKAAAKPPLKTLLKLLNLKFQISAAASQQTVQSESLISVDSVNCCKLSPWIGFG